MPQDPQPRQIRTESVFLWAAGLFPGDGSKSLLQTVVFHHFFFSGTCFFGLLVAWFPGRSEVRDEGTKVEAEATEGRTSGRTCGEKMREAGRKQTSNQGKKADKSSATRTPRGSSCVRCVSQEKTKQHGEGRALHMWELSETKTLVALKEGPSHSSLPQNTRLDAASALRIFCGLQPCRKCFKTHMNLSRPGARSPRLQMAGAAPPPPPPQLRIFCKGHLCRLCCTTAILCAFFNSYSISFNLRL